MVRIIWIWRALLSWLQVVYRLLSQNFMCIEYFGNRILILCFDGVPIEII